MMLPASIDESFELTYSSLHSLCSYRLVALDQFNPKLSSFL